MAGPDISDSIDIHHTLSRNPLVLLDFVATWCEPCKWADPMIDAALKKLDGKILLLKVDIDQYPGFAKENHVLSVPTLVLFKHGKEVWRMRGFDKTPELTRELGKFLD